MDRRDGHGRTRAREGLFAGGPGAAVACPALLPHCRCSGRSPCHRSRWPCWSAPSRPAWLRAAGRWLLALLVGDLALLAAALGIGGEVGLVVAALPRLALFPFQPLAPAAARLPGRIEFGLAVVAGVLGVDLLGRALIL